MTAITTIATIARTATTAIQATQKLSKLQKVAKIAISKPAIAAEGAAIGVGIAKIGGMISKKIKSKNKADDNDNNESDIVDAVEEGTVETEQIIDAQPTETDCEKCNADREIGETIKEKDEKKNTSKKK